MKPKREQTLALVIVGLVAAGPVARAASYTWTADIGDGAWSDTDKWTPAGVPGAADTAWFTAEQTSPFTVSLTGDVSAKLSLGSSNAAKPMVVTFDLNGHTLTQTGGTLDAHRGLDWTLLDGTLYLGLDAGSFTQGYYEFAVTPKITVGAGALLHYNPTNTATYMQIGSRSAAEFVVRDGGRLVTQSAASTGLVLGNSTSAEYGNYTTRLTVTGEGSVWSNRTGTVLLANHAKATAELRVEENARLVHEGSTFTVGAVSGANASLTVASGGEIDARLAKNYIVVGQNGTGTVTVTDALVSLPTNNAFYLANTANTSSGALIIENGGRVEKRVGNHSLYIGNRDGTTGRLSVRSGGELWWVGGMAGVAVGGQGTAAGPTAEFEVTGTGSRAIVGELPIGQTRGYATVTVSDGGILECFRTMYVGRINTNSVSSHNGLARLVVTGAGSVLKRTALTIDDLPGSTISATTSLGIGGCGFQGWTLTGLSYYANSGVPGVYGPGGRGEAVIENGGLVDLNGYIGVYSNSLLRIDGGRMQAARIGLETNAVLNAVLRAGDANGTALMTASTEVRLWGPTLSVERGEDFVAVPGDVYTLISGPLHASINRFTYDGAVLQDGDLIKAGGATFKVGYTSNAVTLTVRQTGTMIRVL